MRTLAVIAILLSTLTTVAFADEVAISTQMAMPRASTACKIIGAQHNLLETYGINLALSDGVQVRDVYEIRRKDTRIAEVMVVFVSANYSLVSLRGNGKVKPKAGDVAVYLRHADVPREAPKMVHYETVSLDERDFLSSRQIPGGNFSPRLNFSSTLGLPNGVSVAGISFGPTFGIPGGVSVSGPTFGGGVTPSNPSFSIPSGVSVQGPTFAPTFQIPAQGVNLPNR